MIQTEQSINEWLQNPKEKSIVYHSGFLCVDADRNKELKDFRRFMAQLEESKLVALTQKKISGRKDPGDNSTPIVYEYIAQKRGVKDGRSK